MAACTASKVVRLCVVCLTLISANTNDITNNLNTIR